MNRRTGLGRHDLIEHSTGDPLDGLVNLFDIGIVLAIAFLIAGLGLTLNQSKHRLQTRKPATEHTQTVPTPSSGALAVSGHGQAVGTVYRLTSGQLVYVQQKKR